MTVINSRMPAMTGPVDPATLTAAQRRCLKLISYLNFHRVRGGHRLAGGSVTVSLKTIEKLEALGLMRQQAACGKKTVALTAAGRQVLAVLDRRQRR